MMKLENKLSDWVLICMAVGFAMYIGFQLAAFIL